MSDDAASPVGTPALEVRAATPGDNDAVLALLRSTMGWDEGGHDAAFFEWKHRDNPFGISPAWLALDEGRIVGYRVFLRWAFQDESERTIRAVRAVDTVTHPDYRGRGIFRTLTLRGVADLTVAGVDWVFNTPNDQSRPGYLKMGWRLDRRLPVSVLPAGPASLRTMAAARAPAELWSVPTRAGLPAGQAVRDQALAAALLRHVPDRGVRTARSPEYLAWRTAFAPLHYRLLLVSERDPAEGGLIFRLRRRGPAIEAAVVESLTPDRRTALTLNRRLLRETGADYAIGLGHGSSGMLRVPRLGPLLTSRALAATPPAPGDWALSLADIELF